MRSPQRVRIISGCWRGRMVRVLGQPLVRPTPNRVRETLFNWLRSDVAGAHCLDAYAGTGVLGFEALSRGARSVVLLDSDPTVVQVLQENRSTLGAENASIFHLEFPSQAPVLSATPFDLVFLDPPFAQDQLTKACDVLETQGMLAEAAKIYCEWQQHPPVVPATWTLWREMQAGKVCAAVYQRMHSHGQQK